MTVPCYHCPDRQEGCHAQCAAYRAFRAELDERNAAAGAEKAPPRRRPKGKGPGGALGALLADLDKENARRGKKGLPPLSYGKYVQLFGR